MNNKRFMKKNAHTEEATEAIHQWKGHMKDMYAGLQMQNDLEEMAMDSNVGGLEGKSAPI